MAGIFVRSGWRQSVNFALFILLLLLGLTFNPGQVRSETISYPAEVEGCWVPLFNSQAIRPTCEASLDAATGYNWSCSPGTVSEFQVISCSTIDPTSGKNITQDFNAYPIYTCPKGGKKDGWMGCGRS